METSEPVSLAEQILVEKSQDSVQVTKKRMQRQSLSTLKDGSPMVLDNGPTMEEVSSCSTQPQDTQKKAKTRFAPEQDASRNAKQGRRSLSKRISDAFGLKKLVLQANSTDVESSAPSLHVKFQSKPEVID